MREGEIPRDQWIETLDDFSKKHEGWTVKIEVIGKEIGDQLEASGMPLVGISADQKDREDRIVIMTGAGLHQHLTHIINKPKRLWLKLPEKSAHEAIKIDAQDGTTTILQFEHAEPEQRDSPR